MSEGKTVDISKLIDEQPIRRFHVVLVILLFCLMLADGYDLQAIGFGAPGIVKELHINKTALGPVFSASLVGMLFGAPLFGWIGDRFGRRPALFFGLALVGVVSLFTAGADNLTELLVLRFLIGIGLGGVPANSVALMAEYAPQRVRATMIVLAQTGLTFGSMLPAVASGVLEGAHGWRPLFLIGGIAPLVLGALGVVMLPESLKFMVVNNKPKEKIWKIAGRLDPRLLATPDVTFVVPGPRIQKAQSGNVTRLFTDGLAGITPLIWVLYLTFLSANYFLHSWMPILFRGEGLSIRETAFAAAMFDVGGVFGALISGRLIDKYGVRTIVALYLVSCPTVAAIGYISHSVPLLSAAIFVAGYCLVGITLCMNATAGSIYPTEIRAKGIGWAYGLGRFGSILSPMVGAWLIALMLPIGQLFLAPVVPLVIGTGASYWLMKLCVRRFRGTTLHEDQRAPAPGAEPVVVEPAAALKTPT
ncbi:MAG TPA: MFS transporter [Caulobacteraceae bacterium]|jgi:AAHS family 4-hydroxybenzoate transporter-like MFS transporter|nr:MFS transporter [Caulobacteraceae bacterium]